MLVSPSARMRIVYCIYLATSFLAYITYAKPFLNDGLSKILITGQFVVCITVSSGYIVGTLDEDNSNQTAIGWLLLAVNLAIIAFALHENRAERLFALINAIQNQQEVDPSEFAEIFVGASKLPLARALLQSHAI